MVFLSRECSSIDRIILYNQGISEGTNVKLCVCYMLQCALKAGFSAPLTNMCSLIAASQASFLCTDGPQRNNLFACSDLSLQRSGFRSSPLSSLTPRAMHSNNAELCRCSTSLFLVLLMRKSSGLG